MASANSPLHPVVAKLEKHATQSRRNFETKFPEAAHKLRDLRLRLTDLRLAGTLIATKVPSLMPKEKLVHTQTLTKEASQNKLREQLSSILPAKVGPISPDTETKASDIIQATLGMRAVARLDGNHLNTTFGYMGAEQLLPRFPGDTAAQHSDLQSKGQTPGKGAWGYFAPSKKTLTHEDIEREKYYVAVQTMYLPEWKTNFKTLRDWYKYRQVLVVNPQNGTAIVADIADAGPAGWTGKQFGGSPLVMKELGLNVGKQKGAVLLFFIDEHDKQVALGPLNTEISHIIAQK